MIATHRLTVAALAFAVGAPLVVAPVAARASEEGRRNTALALGAAAAGLLLSQRDKTAGIIAGVGAAYAYKRYNDAVKDRHDRERYGYYDRYDRGRYDRDGYYRDRYDRNNSYRDRYDRDSYDYDRDSYDRDRYGRNDDRRYYARKDNGLHRGWDKNGKRDRWND